MADRIRATSGKAVARLGLGAREDRFAEGIPRAASAGVRFFFLYHLGAGAWAAALRQLGATDRDGIVIGVGSGSRTPDGLRRSLDRYLDALGTDYIDVFFAEYVHPGDEPDEIHGEGGALEELARWKEQGMIRYVGASAHDRAISRALAEDPRLDVLMQRYNMAHRKVEGAVFPTCRQNDVAVVSFTATRWGSLMEEHPGWDEPPPSALDCYRFCAAHPEVEVVLASPGNDEELREDLRLLDAPEPTAMELERWRRYGDLVYGDGAGSFETDWP